MLHLVAMLRKQLNTEIRFRLEKLPIHHLPMHDLRAIRQSFFQVALFHPSNCLDMYPISSCAKPQLSQNRLQKDEIFPDI